MEALDEEGAGRCRLDGRDVRVPGVLPGERVELEIAEHGARARLLRVARPSPARVTPRCRHAHECGGCAWQHIAYPEQLRLKQARVQAAVDAAAGAGRHAVAPVLGLDAADASGPWGFRHKVHFAFAGTRDGRVLMGHLRRGSRQVIDVAECPVHAPRGNDVAFAVKAALARARLPVGEPPQGIVRHLVSRVGRSSGEVVSTLVAAANVPPLRAVSRAVLDTARPDGWHLNVHPRPGALLFGPQTRHLAGRERVREDVAGVTFLVSPTAFFQTNVEAAALLAAQVVGAVPDGAARVLDLYAGLGFFALPLARRGQAVVAVEESAAAIADGEASAAFNRVPPARCRFVRARAEDALARAGKRGDAYDCVVLDPPREGAVPAVPELVRALAPARIVYVSCAPEALARDLARFLHRDEAPAYRLATVVPIDMFPHTPHVETVVVLDRDPGGGPRRGAARAARLSSA